MKPSTTPTPVNEPSLSYAWYIVGVLTTIYTFSFVDRQIFSLIVGPLRRDLHISDTQVSLLIGFSFAVFYSFVGMLALRMGVGVGEAALSPAAYSLITDYFPPGRLATAISVYSMGIYVGSGLSYLLGGLVVRFASTQAMWNLP